MGTREKPAFFLPRRDRLGRWDLEAARILQERLRTRVETRDRLGSVSLVGGTDLAYERDEARYVAAAVVLDARTLRVVETATARGRVRFPYVPGYLSFREAPAILRALARLEHQPDLLLVDGHGLAHPRGFGIASHLGVLLDLPTIGVAKSILVGEADEPRPERGARAALRHAGRRVGTVLRTRAGVAPVYVSVGHRVSLGTATRWVLRLSAGYRIPEPIRQAHMRVNRLRSEGRW